MTIINLKPLDDARLNEIRRAAGLAHEANVLLRKVGKRLAREQRWTVRAHLRALAKSARGLRDDTLVAALQLEYEYKCPEETAARNRRLGAHYREEEKKRKAE